MVRRLFGASIVCSRLDRVAMIAPKARGRKASARCTVRKLSAIFEECIPTSDFISDGISKACILKNRKIFKRLIAEAGGTSFKKCDMVVALEVAAEECGKSWPKPVLNAAARKKWVEWTEPRLRRQLRAIAVHMQKYKNSQFMKELLADEAPEQAAAEGGGAEQAVDGDRDIVESGDLGEETPVGEIPGGDGYDTPPLTLPAPPVRPVPVVDVVEVNSTPDSVDPFAVQEQEGA